MHNKNEYSYYGNFIDNFPLLSKVAFVNTYEEFYKKFKNPTIPFAEE